MKCIHFNDCNAPICPQDEVSIKRGVWYADEPICRLRANSGMQLVRNQRKIKRAGIKFEDGYFTATMIGRKIMIKKGIKGIDSDKDYTDRLEKKWIMDHRPLKVISGERRKALSEQLKKYHESVAQR